MTDNSKKIESAHAHRKDEHLSLVIWQWRHILPYSGLQFVRLDRPVLPNIRTDQVDHSVDLFGRHFDWPFYIEAMTGGSLRTGVINQKLAAIAKKYHLAMAVGSESIAISEKEAVSSFSVVRETNPEGFIFANIGAGHSLDDAKEAVKIVDANALEIHINAVQELSMNEGDRDFRAWKNNIAKIIEQIQVPVIIKEVGFGMSKSAIKDLADLHPAAINIAGAGGTDFGRIEEARNRESLWETADQNNFASDEDKKEAIETEDDLDFQSVLTSNTNLGISTSESLRFAKQANTALPIIANGGITNSLEVFNAMALGAKMAGIAGYFLFQLSKNNLEHTIESWQKQLPLLYAIYGATNSFQISQLKEIDPYDSLN